MNAKKYELTNNVDTHGLRQIRALIDIPGVCKAGDLGGWIEGEDNLSHDGRCWVSGDARVYGNACVSGSARVTGYACVSGYAQVSGDAFVCCSARVSGSARASGDACVSGDARVAGDAHVFGDAYVYGNSYVCGNAAIVCGVIQAGDHRDAPICIRGSRFFVGWSGVPGMIRSGCMLKSIEFWDRMMPEVAKAHGYSDEEIREYKIYFDAVKLWMKEKGVDKVIDC